MTDSIDSICAKHAPIIMAAAALFCASLAPPARAQAQAAGTPPPAAAVPPAAATAPPAGAAIPAIPPTAPPAKASTNVATPSAFGAEIPIDTGYLKIEWPAFLIPPAQDGGEGIAAVRITAKACKNLGEALLTGRGAWGLGLFSAFGCFHAGATGPDDSPFAGAPAQPNHGWTLKISKKRQSLLLQTYYQGPDPKVAPVLVETVKAELNQWTADLLGDWSYASILASMVLDSMPASRRFAPLQDPSVKTLDLPLGSGEPQPSKVLPAMPAPLRHNTMTLFTLSYDAALRKWKPHVVGSATITGKAPALFWHLTFTSSPERSPVFAHSIKGPGTLQKKATKLLAVRQKSLLTDKRSTGYAKIRKGVEGAVRFQILDTGDIGYIGARIGRELIDPATAVIPPSTIISVLAEVRKGFASGLRLYVDWVPVHGATANGEKLWVGYYRVLAGYSFGLKIPYVVDRLEIAPKIGGWSVNSRLPVFASPDSEEVLYRPFNLSFALGFGFEASAVWEGPKYILRLWHGRDISNPLTKIAGIKRKVLSSRSGIDAVFKGPPVELFGNKWRLGYLAFGYHESLTFAQKSNEAGSFELEFTSSYAGGGLSLSW